MSGTIDRRTRKRLATRQAISDAATKLFSERGFDQVTVDEIAAAADVGRKTVFNHYARKEDMFFDRIGEIQGLLHTALQQRDAGVSPIETLRQFAHRLVAEQSPYLDFSPTSRAWVETMSGSETLRDRARAIRDETASFLAGTLASSMGREPDDPSAALAAGLVLATWSVALGQAHRVFQQREDVQAAQAAFLTLIDQGTTGLKAAMQDTPYA
jgi:AcrR family transcriptional regulator